VSDSPAQHPRISDEERDLIVASIGARKSQAVSYWLLYITCMLFLD